MSANLEAISTTATSAALPRGARVRRRRARAQPAHAREQGAEAARPPATSAQRDAVRALDYRYYWDTWDIRGHTLELGYSRYLARPGWLDGYVRYYRQDKALFYSDNAPGETHYVSRNRQLSTFNDFGLGAQGRVHCAQGAGQVRDQAQRRLRVRALQLTSDFTDVRTGKQVLVQRQHRAAVRVRPLSERDSPACCMRPSA